jgi:transaldolase
VNRLSELHDAGVSIWLDTLSRHLLTSGAFQTLIDQDCVSGATSNPTIFAAAIRGADGYTDQLRTRLADGERDPEALFLDLALNDVAHAADLLHPTFDASAGRDGFVSFECTPDLADDTAATIEQARMLWARLDRPNVMIKVPATAAGLPAIEQLTADGINVNVTLLFARSRYEQVIDAYHAGLEQRLAAGRPMDSLASVASFFVSRIDTKVDAQLPADSPLHGRIAIANAKLAYQLFERHHSTERWQRLIAKGAHPQRPLWASTGTKNLSYSDVLYVEELIGPDVVNTMPDQTLRAFADHGRVSRSVDADVSQAEQLLAQLTTERVGLDGIAAALEREGVESFCRAYQQLLDCIVERAHDLGVELDQPGHQPTSGGT